MYLPYCLGVVLKRKRKLPDGLPSVGLRDEPNWSPPTPERLEALYDGGPCLIDLEGERVKGKIIRFCHLRSPGAR